MSVTRAEKFDPYAFLEKLRLEKERDANHAKRANLNVPISTNSTTSTGLPPKSEIDTPPEGGAIRPADPSSRMAGAEERKTAAGRGKEPGSPGSRKSDEEAYADALRLHGPCGYGGIAAALGWGAGRASVAEIELRKAGRIVYPDKTGRGWLVEKGEPK